MLVCISYFDFCLIYLNNFESIFELHSRIPFDWKNPIGYFIAICLQCFVILCISHYFAFAVSIGVGGFSFMFAFAKDMRSDLRSLNKASNIKNSEKDCFKHFSEFVHLHSNGVQLSNKQSRNKIMIFLTNFNFCFCSLDCSIIL